MLEEPKIVVDAMSDAEIKRGYTTSCWSDFELMMYFKEALSA